MVTIKLFIEGGIVPHANDSANSVNNSLRLREAFKKLFRNAIDENEFKIEIDLMGGWKHAVSAFKTKFSNQTILLIDLDSKESNREQQIKIFDLEGLEGNSFFMIQKMEAWIISQIDLIDVYLSNNYTKKGNNKISEDNLVKNILPMEIIHPDNVLKKIIPKYFCINKNGVQKKLEYGKLKLAPQLIEVLDLPKLQKEFEDVNNLINKINNINI
jgi:hypothetical protein